MRKNIWARLGGNLSLTFEEMEKALSGDAAALREVILAAVTEGRFSLDGESYIPGCCVEDFNRENYTAFPEIDHETDI